MPIKTENATTKALKIKNITSLGNGKFQLNFHDGRNLVSDKKYNVGDTILFDFTGKKILEHLEFKKGAYAIITDGNKMGRKGKIENIGKVVSIKDKETCDTIFDHILVVPEEMV